MTERQLQRTVRFWQKKLRLQNWQIAAEFATEDEMHAADNLGECIAQLCDHTAHIRIIREGDDRDLEITICHELLHVLFAELLPRDPIKEKLFESGVDHVANTLVFLRRGR